MSMTLFLDPVSSTVCIVCRDATHIGIGTLLPPMIKAISVHAISSRYSSEGGAIGIQVSKARFSESV